MKKIIAKIYLALLVLGVLTLCVYGVAYCDPRSAEFATSLLTLCLIGAAFVIGSLIWAINQLD